MKKLSRAGYSMPVKIAAWFLLLISLIAASAFTAAIIFMADTGFYTSAQDEVRESFLKDRLANKCYNVRYHYLLGTEDIADVFKYDNFFFTLTLEDGTVAGSNYNGEEPLYSFTLEYTPGEIGEEYIEYYEESRIGAAFTVWGCIPATMNETDEISIISHWIGVGYRWKSAAFIIALASLFACVLSFIYLMCAAGRKKDKDSPAPGPLDRIPFDLHTGFILLANLLAFDFIYYGAEEIIFWGVFALADFFLLVSYCMSVSSRIKCGRLFRYTVIWIGLSLAWKCVRFLTGLVASFFRNLPLLWKTILGLFVLFVSDVIGIVVVSGGSVFGTFLWLSSWGALAAVSLVVTLNLDRLKKGGETIAAGDLNHRIETRNMIWDFKRHAASLNSIGEGMSRAVDERLKSERFRTELITNVSHDLKTPLTSIINYVDLLKKEKTEDEKIKSYIEVLDRQALRLRKLTEDLIEASKASTGNIQIELAPCELGELLTQTAGEYEDKLRASGLELICARPEEPVTVMADGRQLFRVIDNLMSNILKYAQPSTRVYLNLERSENQARITFRNTSKYALNITSDELMERFVRGDASRHNEGSGLGLSIAKSLAELQHGSMNITVDGDLFKVTLAFETV